MPRRIRLPVLLALAVLAGPLSAQQAPIDVAALAPRSLVYSMSAMGNHIMDSTRDITREEVDGVDAVVVRSVGESGLISSTSDLAVSVADFRPIRFNLEMSQGGMGLTQRLRAADGRVTGSMEAGGQQIDVDEPLPEGVYFSGMEELLLQATDWATTDSLTFKVFAPGQGVVDASAHQTGTERVTVPAGEFDAYAVQIRLAGQEIDLLLRQEAPHILLKQTVPAQGMSVELKEIRKQE